MLKIPVWRLSNTHFLYCTAIFCAIVLFLTWPFHHTIAARNIAIGIGFLSSFLIIFFDKSIYFRFFDFIVPIILLCIPLWLWIIYWLFPVDSVYQLKELKGTWVRITALIFFGFILGKILFYKPLYQKYLVASLLLIPLIVPVVYLFRFQIGIGIELYPNFFKTKSAGAYYVMYAFLLILAIGANILIQNALTRRNRKQLIFISSALLVFFYDFLLLESFNGILWSGIILLIFIICLIFYLINNKKLKNYINFTWLIIFVFSFISISALYIKNDFNNDKKAFHFFEDIRISLDIESNRSWQRSSETISIALPVNSSGIAVNVSTFERVSWFLKGLQILKEYPLGTGDAYFSFGRYMRDSYPGSTVMQTHSGWLDFALGVGVLGLLLIFGAIILLLARAKSNIRHNENIILSLSCISVIGGIGLMFISTELSDRELIEELFFIMAIFSGALFHKSSMLSYEDYNNLNNTH